MDVLELTERDEFLVLACDGLWDVFSDKKVVELVRAYKAEHRTLRGSPTFLRDLALQSGSMDNITVLVIDLTSQRAKIKSSVDSDK